MQIGITVGREERRRDKEKGVYDKKGKLVTRASKQYASNAGNNSLVTFLKLIFLFLYS
jgi:hypothetical protein